MAVTRGYPWWFIICSPVQLVFVATSDNLLGKYLIMARHSRTIYALYRVCNTFSSKWSGCTDMK